MIMNIKKYFTMSQFISGALIAALIVLPGQSSILNAGQNPTNDPVCPSSSRNASQDRSVMNGELTMARAKKIALKQHPSMASALERITQAREVVTQARADYLPTVSTTAGWDYNENTQNGSGQADETLYTTRLSVTQVLFNGFYRKYSLTSARYLETMSQEDHEDAKRILTWSVAQAYLNLQLARENITIAQSDMNFNQRRELEAAVKEKAGTGSLSDILNFKTKVNAAKLSLLTAQQDVREASRGLSVLMGFEDAHLPKGLTIAPLSEAVDISETVKGIEMDHYISQRPDLKKAALSVKNAQTGIRMVKASYYPTISLTGAYGTNAGNSPADTDSMGASLGLNVTFDIFTGGSRQSQLQAALSKKRELEKDLEEAKMTAVSNIKTAEDKIDTTKQQLDLQIENTALVRTTRDLVDKEYSAGQASLVRLNEAQNDLINSLGELSKARVSLILALEEYDYYIGKNFNQL